MTYRCWKYEDIFKITQLEKETFKEPWNYKTFATLYDMPNFYCVIAEDGADLVGYGCLQVAADCADLENLAVAEQYRKCGAGRKMLEMLVEHCASCGVREITLEVRVSNTPAQLLYLKSGFNGIYTRPHYYADGEDCIVMRKDLT